VAASRGARAVDANDDRHGSLPGRDETDSFWEREPESWLEEFEHAKRRGAKIYAELAVTDERRRLSLRATEMEKGRGCMETPCAT